MRGYHGNVDRAPASWVDVCYKTAKERLFSKQTRQIIYPEYIDKMRFQNRRKPKEKHKCLQSYLQNMQMLHDELSYK